MVETQYRVIITQFARQSIRRIVDFIKTEDKSPQNAERVRKAIFEKAKSLKTQPKSFSDYSLLHSSKYNHRSIAVWNYIIVYEVDEKRKLVIIDDVFHGAQDK